MKALWLIIALCLSVVVAVTMAEAQQCSRPLIRTQIERALAIPVPDEAIALEIRTCGLDFTPDAEYVEKLRGLKVFPLTTKAVEALLPKAPKPIPTPLRKPTPTLPVGSDFAETVNGVQLAMVRVPAGSFTMGAPFNEAHRDNEGPQHLVNVPAFAIGKYEITQAQWRAVMRNNPSSFRTANFADANLPVENVSWNEAKD